VALLETKGFSAHDFKVFHPGGKLGASLKYVSDLMHSGEAMPLVPDTALMSEAIVAISAKSLGCVGVTDANGRLVGMITDGDLRRHMRADLMQVPVTAIMTRGPNTLSRHVLASKALEQFNARKRTQMFIVEDERPVGILHVHDLLRAGVA
jgi:arabinose-5-phosphate isomerase